MRIGILGGSFDPIHNGHLLMAELARQKMQLDKVIFMPAHCSPYKSSASVQSGAHRLNMAKLAIQGNPFFAVGDEELKRGGISYTVDTLRVYRAQHPKAQLFWIVGEDNIDRLESWKYFSEIVRLACFIAVSRSWFNISSSEIRRLVKSGKSIRYLTPDRVIGYIRRYRLYV